MKVDLAKSAMFSARLLISRLQRFRDCYALYPGRCPGLSHFAPLALKTRSFHPVSIAGGSLRLLIVDLKEPTRYREVVLTSLGGGKNVRLR